MIVFTARQAALRLSVLVLALGALAIPAHAAAPTYTLDSPPPPGASILYCVDTSTGPPYIAHAVDATHNCGIGGGGAATVADGADVAEGAKNDPSSAHTVVGFLNGLFTIFNANAPSTAALQGTLNTTAASIDSKVTNAGTPQLVAGENHAGEVGNNEITITSAQTVTAASAYASGNAVGGLMTFASAARVNGASGAGGTSGMIQSAAVNSKSLQSTQMDLILFNANPSGSTCTDKSAISVAAADFDKIIGVAHVTDWTALGTPSVGQAQNLAMPYALTSNTTLYGCLVTRSTPTFTATTDISVAIRAIRN